MYNLLSFWGLFKRNRKIWILLGLSICGLAVALLISVQHQRRLERRAVRGVEEWKAFIAQKPVPERSEPEVKSDSSPKVSLPPSSVPAADDRKRIALVIDDFGWNDDLFNLFADVEESITIAVLPFLSYSRTVAQLARQRNMEVILHLPMEPMNYPEEDPGKGALFSSMTDEELRSTLLQCMEAVPFISGINNHMGSRATRDERVMKIVLQELRSRGLYFLDSLTEPDSVALMLSRELGVKAAQRDVFLDNDDDEEKAFKQLMQLLRVAQKRGWAIGIGHPHLSTLRALKRVIPIFREDGVEIVPVSRLVK